MKITTIILLALAATAQADVHEVADFKALLTACESAQPGDEIVIHKGVYTITGKSRILITGRPGPVTVRGATGKPEDVVIEGLGQDNEAVQMAFELTGSPKWTFQDLTTRNTYFHGFKFNTSSTDCVLRNVVMRDHGESGVKGTSDPDKGAYPDRLLVEKCDIGFSKETGGTRSVVEGIDGVAVQGWIIRNNRFVNVQKGGKPAYGAFTKGNSLETVIEGNRFENCFIGASFGGGGTGAAYFRDHDQSLEHRWGVIRNNVFIGCTDAAIYINKGNACKIEDNEMTGCGMNIQLRFPGTTARVKGNTAKDSKEPVVRLRDGALLLESGEDEKPWTTSLYGADWSPTPPLSFAKDKILQDFSYAGYANGGKAIPDLAGARRFDVVADFGADASGATDSTAAIQKAIDAAAAAGGGVVDLPAGTYRVQPQADRRYALCVRKSGIVLRGAGPEKTFLLNTAVEMREKIIVLFQASSTAEWGRVEGNPVKIAADVMGPSVEIPVEDAGGFKAGDWVVIRCEPNKDWVMDHKETDWLGEENKIGSIQYLRRIVAVEPSRKVLTIDVPTRYYLKKRDQPEVYQKTGLLEQVGLEAMSIGNVQHPGKDGWKNLDFAAPTGGYTKRLAESRGLPEDFASVKKSAFDVHSSYAVAMGNVNDGWIRDVHSFRPEGNTTGCHMLSNGIRLKECRGVTIERCYFQRPQYGGGGGNGYMYRLDNSNECLVQDSRAEACRHGFSISGMSSSGNVVSRCLDKDTARQTGGTGQEETEGRSSDHHQWFSHSNLFDNCTADNSWFEARDRFYTQLSRPRHNLTSAHTVYWNMEGLGNSFHPFVVWSQQADYGYVIGTRGAVNQVKTDGKYPDRKERTDPVDVVEGIGKGATLSPASLFEDQRRRRLGNPAGK